MARTNLLWLLLCLPLLLIAADDASGTLTFLCNPTNPASTDQLTCQVTVNGVSLTIPAGQTGSLTLTPSTYTVQTTLTGAGAQSYLPNQRTDSVTLTTSSNLTLSFNRAATIEISLFPTTAFADLYIDQVQVATQANAISVPVVAGAHTVEAKNVTNGHAVSQVTNTFSGWTRHLTLDLLAVADPAAVRASYTWRFGVGVPNSTADAAWVARLGSGWWYDWRTRPNLGGAVGEYWQMIRLWNCTLNPAPDIFQAEARRRPGQTWIIGNEPDVSEQDKVTPECLADLYHQAYTALKTADPTAKVAMGGVVQASPLRLKYLDQALAYYQTQYGAPLPVDIWTMHAYILREDPANWGAGVPTGLPDPTGWLIQPDDHDNLATFQTEIKTFRQWMADHNYRNKPLVISEFGILLPENAGFTPDRVRKYMLGTFDYLTTATDPALGLPSDSNRLVQRWAWFSLAYDPFPTSNLYDPAQKALTPLGQTFRDYIKNLK